MDTTEVNKEDIKKEHNPEEFRMILYKETFRVKAWKFIKKIFKRNRTYVKM